MKELPASPAEQLAICLSGVLEDTLRSYLGKDDRGQDDPLDHYSNIFGLDYWGDEVYFYVLNSRGRPVGIKSRDGFYIFILDAKNREIGFYKKYSTVLTKVIVFKSSEIMKCKAELLLIESVQDFFRELYSSQIQA
jgi:hypothetical protein